MHLAYSHIGEEYFDNLEFLFMSNRELVLHRNLSNLSSYKSRNIRKLS